MSMTKHKRALLLHGGNAAAGSGGTVPLLSHVAHLFHQVFRKSDHRCFCCTNLIQQGVQHANTEHSARCKWQSKHEGQVGAFVALFLQKENQGQELLKLGGKMANT